MFSVYQQAKNREKKIWLSIYENYSLDNFLLEPKPSKTFPSTVTVVLNFFALSGLLPISLHSKVKPGLNSFKLMTGFFSWSRADPPPMFTNLLDK